MDKVTEALPLTLDEVDNQIEGEQAILAEIELNLYNTQVRGIGEQIELQESYHITRRRLGQLAWYKEQIAS